MDTVDPTELYTLCRICLTKRPNMTHLDSTSTKERVSILEMLQQVVSQKIHTEDNHPAFICPTCKNLLDMAYELIVLFRESQSCLANLFENTTSENPATDVELIFGDQKFDLKDVIIEEESQQDERCFEGFLNNLGTAVSAVFVKKSPTKTINDVERPESESPLEVSCPYCPKKLASKTKLVTHFKQSHHRLLKICKTCGLKNTTSNAQCRKCAPTKYLCHICGHVNNSSAKARLHRLTHEGKTFECHICGKKFLYKISLDLHVKRHAGERNQLCTLCGKTFFYCSALIYHMRMHSNERRYKCEYCGKSFYMQSALKRHTYTHTKERPFVCGFCDRGFRSSGEKKKHEMIHKGEKPYECRFCPKAFRTGYTLLLHHMAHSGPHECGRCDRTFMDVEFLKRHVEKKHPV